MPYLGALCFPPLYGNPLISLGLIFPPGVPPRFPGVLQLIDFIRFPFSPVCPPILPYALRARFIGGARVHCVHRRLALTPALYPERNNPMHESQPPGADADHLSAAVTAHRLARLVERLMPDRRDPERFHAEKSVVIRACRRLAQRLDREGIR